MSRLIEIMEDPQYQRLLILHNVIQENRTIEPGWDRAQLKMELQKIMEFYAKHINRLCSTIEDLQVDCDDSRSSYLTVVDKRDAIALEAAQLRMSNKQIAQQLADVKTECRKIDSTLQNTRELLSAKIDEAEALTKDKALLEKRLADSRLQYANLEKKNTELESGIRDARSKEATAIKRAAAMENIARESVEMANDAQDTLAEVILQRDITIARLKEESASVVASLTTDYEARIKHLEQY